ncbi:MAG: class I SAM-dependent methyltransferase [bacterium]
MPSGGGAESEEGVGYHFQGGIPDLRQTPERFAVDLPWYEPWEDLEALDLTCPTPLSAPDLPPRLDAPLASIPGEEGVGRWILEVGCGERLCEPYFAGRGFRYVGIDFDHRGAGPQVLADAHNLPFQSGSFDLYTSLAVYEHLASPLQAALEAFRVLREGGTFFGTAAFVYGFHDRASFHHMSHAGLLWILRMAGFRVERIWSDWAYMDSIPQMAFGPGPGKLWQMVARRVLKTLDASFIKSSNLARRTVGKPLIDRSRRAAERAGSLSFEAVKLTNS